MTKNCFGGFILYMDICGISFCAKPINDVIIQKYNKKTGLFDHLSVKFIKIEPDNKNDIRAIDKAAQKWTDAKYIRKIATASHWSGSLPIDIYAVTTQKDKFNMLKPNRILGFAEMRKDKNFPKYDWLYHLQVKPEAINVNNPNPQKEYKHVGTSILNSLKKVYKNIFLYSEDSPNIEKFYRDNGFIEEYIFNRRFYWSSNFFNRLKIYLHNKFNIWGI